MGDDLSCPKGARSIQLLEKINVLLFMYFFCSANVKFNKFTKLTLSLTRVHSAVMFPFKLHSINVRASIMHYFSTH